MSDVVSGSINLVLLTLKALLVRLRCTSPRDHDRSNQHVSTVFDQRVIEWPLGTVLDSFCPPVKDELDWHFLLFVISVHELQSTVP